MQKPQSDMLKYGINTSEATEPSTTYLFLIRTRIPYYTKAILCTGIDWTGLTVVRNTLENLLAYLRKNKKEHLKESSTIDDHQTATGHQTTKANFSIVGRERFGFARTITESLFTLRLTMLLK